MLTDSELDQLQGKIRYVFGDRRLLVQALTHVSYGHEKHQELPLSKRDNERLEFLGDAVLDLVISDLLLEAFPDAHEGQLSKMRAAVVNEKTLYEITKPLGIASLMRLGKGEKRTGGADKPSILSSAFEAVIAAVYLDGGFNAVYPVIRHLFSPLFREETPTISFQDFKTKLQEEYQGKFKQAPTYHLISAQGPDHAKIFEIEVRMGSEVLSIGQGTSKKDAEQNAAKNAWMALQAQKEENQ